MMIPPAGVDGQQNICGTRRGAGNIVRRSALCALALRSTQRKQVNSLTLACAARSEENEGPRSGQSNARFLEAGHRRRGRRHRRHGISAAAGHRRHAARRWRACFVSSAWSRPARPTCAWSTGSTIGWGIALQCVLAVLVLKVDLVYKGFEKRAAWVKQFIGFSDKGAKFVFGNMADASRRNSAAPGRGCSNAIITVSVRLRRPAAHPVRVGVLHRALPLRHLAMVRPALRPRHGLPDAHQRRRDAVGLGQRVHGPDRGAADRQAVCAAHDAIRSCSC